jgi:hypothetical protein
MQDNNETTAKEALMSIIKRDNTLGTNEDNIINGSKIRNEIMRKLADAFRDNKNDERYIVEILLALDESAEKGYLTNELFEEIKKNPEVLKDTNLKRN